MGEIWFISDTHFSHGNCVTKFKRADGSPLRDFRDVDHMDAVMIANWNRVVSPQDKVYHLGDVTLSNEALRRIMPQLNGKKRLILGNHDTQDIGLYVKYFERISSWRHFTDKGRNVALICTHFPLHKSSLLGRYDGRCLNVHGHIHARTIPDPAYKNICVEQIDYTPISYGTLLDAAERIGVNG